MKSKTILLISAVLYFLGAGARGIEDELLAGGLTSAQHTLLVAFLNVVGFAFLIAGVMVYIREARRERKERQKINN